MASRFTGFTQRTKGKTVNTSQCVAIAGQTDMALGASLPGELLRAGGNIVTAGYANTTGVGNPTTTVSTSVYTYALAAGSFDGSDVVDGTGAAWPNYRELTISAFGTFAGASTRARRATVTFGTGISISITDSTSTAASVPWSIDLQVIEVTQGSFVYRATTVNNTTFGLVVGSETADSGTAAITIGVLLQTDTAGHASDAVLNAVQLYWNN